MGYFNQHVFVCTNQRDNGEACCQDHQASVLWQYLKKRVADLGLNGQGQMRINKAGCLDRCAEGPVLVVYPQGIWYTFVDQDDIDEILERHLIAGEIVERLRLPDPA